MSIEHSFFAEAGLVLTSWLGDISDEELLVGYKGLYEHPHWHPGFNELSDLSQADMRSVSRHGLEALQKSAVRYFGNTPFKTAIFAPHDLTFGFARMYEGFAAQSPQAITVFRDLQPALDWLHVESSELRKKIIATIELPVI